MLFIATNTGQIIQARLITISSKDSKQISNGSVLFLSHYGSHIPATFSADQRDVLFSLIFPYPLVQVDKKVDMSLSSASTKKGGYRACMFVFGEHVHINLIMNFHYAKLFVEREINCQRKLLYQKKHFQRKFFYLNLIMQDWHRLRISGLWPTCQPWSSTFPMFSTSACQHLQIFSQTSWARCACSPSLVASSRTLT